MDEEKLTVSPMTLDALVKALESEKPLPLKSVTRQPGLLPGGRDTRVKQEARAQCMDARLGLFEKVGGADDNPVLRVTPTGIETLFVNSLPEQRTELLTKAAASVKSIAEATVTKLAAAELKEVGARQEALAKRAGELRTQLARMLSDQLASAERVLAEVTEQATELRKLVADTARAPAESADPEPVPEPPPARPRAETDGDIDFQRDLCRELALTWEDTPEPEARAALERVMFNAGLEQIGEADEVVPFDAGRHKLVSGNGVLPGHSVKVVEPGWEFRSPRGVLQIVQPKVAPQ